ncbi:MAG: LysM peptidoglycan-binding domain-containing protein [Anaerolineales bacterium]|nr:LysM peptidoglycan-binding domain-containing protein [Anaerolineales bacterium]
MKRALLLFAFLLAACAPQTVAQTPVLPGALRPYTTRTPSATPEQPDGLVVSFETPVPTSTPFVYAVQAGDTMSGIAFKFGVSLDELLVANPDVSPNSMSIGTKLNIPSDPANPTGASTSMPVPVSSPQGASVEQIECYPTADRGMWCFVLIHNDTPDVIENLSAQVTLLDVDSQTLASALALSPLNILPPGDSLPLMVFFPPLISADARSQVQLLTGIPLQSDDERYLPVTLHNTLAQVDASGRNAQVSGTVRLPEDAPPASLVWVAAVAYDRAGRVVGVRRWESTAGITAGGSFQFAFEVSSLARAIERVEFVAEARP